MLNWKYLFASVVIVGLGFLGYLSSTDQLPAFLNGRLFLSQVTPIEQTDLTYLQNLTGLAPLNVTSIEELQQKLIETLLLHVNEFDQASATAAEDYLKKYYDMTDPIPPSVLNAIAAAAQKFLQAQIVVNANTTTFSPFINQVLSVMANHEVSTNHHQAVKRAQTSRALLDALINQL
ncbi:MAG: hypothetical protein AB7J40_01650 [Candidatus Altimarinota bacterium]